MSPGYATSLLTITNFQAFPESDLIPSLSDGLGITVWSEHSELFGKRIGLLQEGGPLGLPLAVVVRALFLEMRLAVRAAATFSVSAT